MRQELSRACTTLRFGCNCQFQSSVFFLVGIFFPVGISFHLGIFSLFGIFFFVVFAPLLCFMATYATRTAVMLPALRLLGAYKNPVTRPPRSPDAHLPRDMLVHPGSSSHKAFMTTVTSIAHPTLGLSTAYPDPVTGQSRGSDAYIACLMLLSLLPISPSRIGMFPATSTPMVHETVAL